MIDKKCLNCSFDNDVNAIYCQNCGSKLPEKESFKQFVKSLNLGSTAGAGAKGISVAPLAGMELDKTNNDAFKNSHKLVTKQHRLENGDWYCPYCGTRNKRTNYQCKNCGDQQP